MTPNIKFTLQHNLCTGCGVCAAACPTAAIKIIAKKGRYIPQINDSKCNNNNGCHRCYDACPGIGVNIASLSQKLFKDNNSICDTLMGRYLQCFIGYSKNYDIRYHCASGGMVSHFIIWLLENKIIDGAIVTRFDSAAPFLSDSFIATTREEVISARSSKYSPVSLHKALCELKSAHGKRYVIVGLPCHIQGVRKLIESNKRFGDKIIGLFSIFCSSGRSFYMTEHIFKERGINLSGLSYFQYRDEGCLGKMVVKCQQKDDVSIRNINEYCTNQVENGVIVYREDYQSYCHPLRSFFIPKRCLYCIDHFGELGDICFGDIHVAPYSTDKVGINSIIVRDNFWLNLLKECHKDGHIFLEELSAQVLVKAQPMVFKKKGRNGAFINIGKTLGREVPIYNVDYLRKPSTHDWVDYFQNRFQQFLGTHKVFWPIVTRLKSKINIH